MRENALRRSERYRRLLAGTAVGVLCACLLAPLAFANPTDPNASDSGVTYSGLGTSNEGIDLDKSHTIINWGSFDIAPGDTTSFYFGSKNWFVFNRVSNGSADINGNLYGCLNAACSLHGGNVWLYASDGVIIGPDARVNVGGFLATTSPLSSDGQFLSSGSSGQSLFDFGASVPGASVTVKSGAQINAASGSVALVAPQVTTEAGSSIKASGNVLYGAASSYRVKFAQDGSDDLDLIDFEVPAGRAGGTSSSHPITVGGNTTARNVFITSVSKQSVADAIIDVTGSVVATSASAQGGDIVLSGDGDVNVSGKLSGAHVSLSSAGGTTTVSGVIAAQEASGAGGTITVTAPDVALTGSAVLNASGTTGGTILVGGDIHGGAIRTDDFSSIPLADATLTTVASGAVIMADGSAGKGGNVVVWSNQKTNFAGKISATGNGGNGGFTEVSSHGVLAFTGRVDLTATNGKTGTLLFDPEDLYICASPCTTNSTLSGSGPYTYTANGDSSTLLNTDLEAELALANVVVTTAGTPGAQNGDIYVQAPVTWASGNTLTLDAYHSIFLQAAINGGATDMIVNDGGTGGVIEFDTGGSATTTAGQIYNGPVSLTVDTTLTDTGGGAIDFVSTVDGAFALDTSTTGTTTFGGAVGGTTPLTSVDVESGPAALNGGAVSTTGAQTYSGAVTLGATTTLTSSGGGAIDFVSTVDGAFALTADTSGLTTFGGAVGGTTALTSVDVKTGAADLNGGSVSTSGSQEYNGAVTLSSNADLTGSAIKFDSTVDALTSGGESLTTNGGTTFGGAVGATENLSSLLVNGTAAINGGSVTTTGTQTYQSAVTLGGGSTNLTGTTVTFNSTLDGAEALTVTGDAVIDGPVGDFTPLTSLDVTGTTAINTNAIKAATTQLYQGAVTLSGNATLTGTTVTFDSTLDGAVADVWGLAISGDAVFDGVVGGANSLASLSVSGTTVLNTGAVTTGGTQTYTGATTLNEATTNLSGSSVTFGQLDGASALTVTGNADFGGAVGGSTPLTSIDVTGTTDLNGGAITTTGGQTYSGAVTLSADADLTNTGSSAIDFASTVDGGFGLTTNTTGTTTFGGAVGGSTALASLTTSGSGGTVSLGNVTTTGNQTYNNTTVDLNGTYTTTSNGSFAVANAADLLGTTSVSTGSGAITFDGTVNGAFGLTTTSTGTTTFAAAVGGTTPLLSLTTNGAGGTVTLKSVTTSGAQTYNNSTVDLNGTYTTTNSAFTVANAADLLGTTSVSTGSGAITFDGTVNGAFGLTTTSTGTTTFAAAVGGTTPLLSLTTNGAGGTVTLKSVTTSGAQTYNNSTVDLNGTYTTTNSAFTVANAADLLGTTSVSTGSGAITFDGTVNGAFGLTTTSTGTTTFAAAVGGTTPLLSLTTNGAGGTVTLKSVTTSGAQTYNNSTVDLNGTYTTTNSAFTVANAADLLGTTSVSTGSGAITFDGTVNGAFGLTTTSTGTTTFAAAVGGTTPLLSLTTNGAGGTVTLKSVTTSGAQTYNNSTVDLNGTYTTTNSAFTVANAADLLGTTSVSTGSGAITFDGTVNGAFGLTTTSTGTTTFDGIVGGTTALTSLDVTGLSTIDTTAITTTGTQDYQGAVTLAAATTNLTGSTVTFGSTVDGANALTVTGNAAFDGAVGQTTNLTSLDVTGTTDLNGGPVTTTGAQTYQGAVTLTADADLTGSSITFDSTVNGGFGLTTNGPTTFDGAVGGTTALASLLVNGTSDINGGAVTTTGSQEYNGNVTLSADADLTGSSIIFDHLVDALTSGGESLTTNGATTFDGAVGSNEKLSSLLVNGTTDINGGSITTTTTQEYNGGVTLSADADLTGSSITFDSTVNGAHGLTTNGPTTFKGAVGGTTALASLLVNGTSDLNGGGITTTGTQEYNGAVTLSADADLTGSTVTFDSTVDGAHALTVTGDAVFDGIVGGTTALTSLDVTGLSTIDTTAITTTGTQDYQGAVTLAAATTNLTGSTVTFGSTVDGANALTVTGNAAFDGAVGQTTNLTSLDVTGTTDLNGGPVTTTGAQTYQGAVTLTADADLTGSSITFDSTVNGGFGLTTNGPTTFDGAVGGTTALASLLVNGTSDINGGAVTTTGSQEYNGNVTLSADADLTGSSIIFDHLVDALTSGGESLTTNGATTFDGAVGSNEKLSSLLVNGTTDINGGSITTTTTQEYNGGVTLSADADLTGSSITFDSTVNGAHGLTTNGPTTFKGAVGGTTALASLLVNGTSDLNGGGITTTGTQEYNGAVTLSADADLTGSTVTFDSTVDGAHALTVTGDAVFDGIVGGTTALTSLDVTGLSTIDTTAITTTGTQDYQGAVTLAAATTNLTGSTVTFGSTVDGANALTVTGNAAFDGAVGQTTNLTSLDVTGTTDLNGGPVTTTGAQTYQGAVTLTADADLTGSSITFDSTVNGGFGLTTNGPTTFDGAVGGTTALASLLVNGTSDIDTDEIRTTGTQEYNGAVTLSAVTTGLTGSTVTFDSTVDGANALTVTGNAVFDGEVGQTTNLTSIDVTGTTDINTDKITTTGAQTYQGAVTLTSDTTLTSTGTALIDFDSTVDGQHALTVASNAEFDGEVGVGAGNALTSLDVTGTTDINTDKVTTTGTQTYQGAVTLTSDTTLTSTGTALIDFDSTVDGQHALTVASNAEFDGEVGVGAGNALTSLDVTGTTDINTDAITTSGTQDYQGAVTLNQTANLSGSTVTFHNTLDAGTAGTQALTVTGDAAFEGEVGVGAALASLDVTGTTDINTDKITTTGAQTYQGAVTLTSDTTLTSTGTALIDFDSTVDGQHALTVASNAEFDGEVGVGAGNALTSLDVTGTTDINTDAITTSGTQDYQGAVTLNQTANLTGSTVTFHNTLDAGTAGTQALTVTGNAVFDNVVGGAAALASLDVTGTSDINTSTITTTGTQDYQGAVTLSSTTNLTGSQVTFGSTLDAATAGAEGLTVTGNAVFDGVVGGIAALAFLDVTGTTDINASAVTTTGAQTYANAVTLTSTTDLTAPSVTFDSTVNAATAGGEGLTINGIATFDGAVGGTAALASLLVNGTSDINGGSVTTTGSQEYNGAVTLSADATLTGSAITFDSTVDAATAGVESLTVDGTSGAVAFDGAVGSIAELKNLTVTAGTTITGGAMKLTSALDLVAGSTITITGPVLAASLTGSSVGNVSITGANQIPTLVSFDTGNGNFVFDDTVALSITGALDAGTGTVDLELGSNAVGENGGTGSITAAVLTGSSGTATLTGTNAVATLANYTTNNGNFTLDNGSLSITGALNAGSGAVDLVSTGTIDEAGGTGTITAASLTGSSVGGATLTGTNVVPVLAGWTNVGAVGFSFTDDPALTVTADVNSGTGDLTLTTVGGSANGMVLNANLIAGTASGTQTVTLDSAGSINQTAGTITGATLTGSSDGGTTLNDANGIGILANFTNSGSGDIQLTDANPLLVTGTIDNPAGNITVDVTGAGNAMTVVGNFDAADTITLDAAGDFIQNNGAIDGTDVVITAGGNLLIGEPTFTNLVANRAPGDINQGGVPFFTPSAPYQNHVFINAEELTLSAPQRIVVENTGTPPTAINYAPNGVLLTHNGTATPALLIGGDPTVTDLFGVLIQDGTAIGPRAIAATSQIEFLPGTNPNSLYRFNGCVIHQLGTCTVVSFTFQNFEPAQLAELVVAAASNSDEVEEDLTITGADNDEIWAAQ